MNDRTQSTVNAWQWYAFKPLAADWPTCMEITNIFEFHPMLCVCSKRPQIIQMHYAQFTDDGCITTIDILNHLCDDEIRTETGVFRATTSYKFESLKEFFFFLLFHTSVINCYAYRFMTFDGRIIFRPRTGLLIHSHTHQRRYLYLPLCFGDIVIR